MASATDEAVSTIEHLDFAPECGAADDCHQEARWIVYWSLTLKCPHMEPQTLLCDDHHDELVRAICDNLTATCSRHGTLLGRVREIILRIEPL